MSVRVYKLAAELGKTSKELIAYLSTQGHKVSSHMSAVEDNVAAILRDRMKPKTPPKEKEKADQVDGQAATAGGTPAAGQAARQDIGKPRRTERRPDSGAPPDRSGWTKATPKGQTLASADARESKTRVREKTREKERGEKERGEKERDAPKAKGPKKVRYFPSDDYLYQQSTRYGGGVRRKQKSRGPSHAEGEQVAVVSPERPDKIEVEYPVTLKDLSAVLGVKAQVLIKTLMRNNKIVTINQYLDEELLTVLGVELGTEIVVKKKAESDEEAVRAIEEYKSDEKNLVARAPVVTFLGHVDHGKTSLLDKIRKTSVTQKEAGGITQHIGAYRVDKGNVHVVFIDTPGHHAFTEMRARGANATDVAVLVVAADDGPMPQTEEAINHARAAKVPILVALNKIDKPTANPQRCKEGLAKLGLTPVEWNGDTEYIEVSAITGEGIDTLLETLSLESEILELKADPTRPAVGVVLEAEATPSRGVVATVLVQDGTLKVGDYALCGPSHGRVRSLFVNGVEPTDKAEPSVPVKLVGLNRVPDAGEKLYVLEDQHRARTLAESRLRRTQQSERAERQKAVSIDDLFSRMTDEQPELRIVLKADVKGSVEALRNALESIETEEVKVQILHAGVGAISQEDVNLAAASKAIILGFLVMADDRAKVLAEESQVEIRSYRVIYEAIEDVKAALSDRLTPESVQETHGRAEIRQIYRASKVGNIAGCMVTDGFLSRGDKVRLYRDGREIYSGDLISLRRFKEDVKEVREGFECGLKIADYEDIKEGDVVESYAVVEKPRTL